MELTDAQLISAYLNGDKNAFDVLVMRYLKTVYSVVFYFVKNQADAEDLTQDVFVKLLHNLKRFDQSRNFKPWILQIAKNQALDWLKRKKPLLLTDFETEEGESLLANLPDCAPLPDAIVLTAESNGQLTNAIKLLTPKERSILQYRYQKELSFKEIAEELNEAMDTVKSRCRRAVQKLKKILAESSYFSS